MIKQYTHGYAFLIGVTENKVTRWALSDVDKDITALAKVLTDPKRCAYPMDNVKTLTGQAATRQGILEGVDWLQERIIADASDNATIIIYYSGHGWCDASVQPPAFYFIPYDVRENAIKLHALPAAEFAEAISGLSPRRLLVILDCCHAAGMRIKDAVTLPGAFTEAAIPPSLLMTGEKTTAGPDAKGLEALAQGHGRAVLSSSQGEQKSYLRRDGQMSIFTYHLIEALTGHAQPQAGATEVLISDVMSHVWRSVPYSARTDWGVEQTPDYQVSGNFPVALLLGGKGLSPGQPAPDPLAKSTTEEAAQVVTKIDTGGGALIRGRVDTGGGDFVGRDKIVHGDVVHGDKVMGDKAGWDIYKVSNVSGTGIAIGPQAQAQVSQGLGGDEIANFFAKIYQQIEARPEDSGVDKEELAGTVQKIQKEVGKGEHADPTWVERRLKSLALMAPDIFEVTVTTLASPIVGMATVIRKVAEKVKAEVRQS